MNPLAKPLHHALFIASISLVVLAASKDSLFLAVDSVTKVASGTEQNLRFLSGRAFTKTGDATRFDIVFAIDVSGSTARQSGADIDGDGKTGGGFGIGRLLGGDRGSGDNILAAEVAAVRGLLGTFDPRTTRVGIVAFAGSENPGENHAWIEVSLTSDYAEVRRSLEAVQLAGSSGGTNMYAGLRVAGKALLGSRLSAKRSRAQKHMVLLTDGIPTLPKPGRGGSADAADPSDRAIAAARSLAKRGIRIHTFAIGRDAVANPRAAAEVAKASGGSYEGVANPAELGRLLAQIQFASLKELHVRNLTTGAPALELVRNADGSFAALLEMAPGVNRIEVVALSSDGSRKRIEVSQEVGSGSLTLRQQTDRARLLAAARASRKLGRRRELEIGIDPNSPE